MKSKVMHLGISLFFTLLLSITPSISEGGNLTHRVKKGDTLWSICEKYYGDPYLWPELWELNQFITNPHWISPGEVIRLFEYKEIIRPPVKKEEEPKEQIVKIKKLMGVDVSSFTTVNATGLLLQEMIAPWGRIFDFDTEKIMLSEGDTVYLKMYKENIKSGDIFTIYSVSGPVDHPLTNEKFGYIYSFKGILEMGKAQKGFHIAQIKESFESIDRNDLILPYTPIQSCILPIPCRIDNLSSIVAAKDKTEVLGQYSVVYIDAGFSQNVQTGNIFDVIQERESIAEPKPKEMVLLPHTVLGKVLILTTTEHTSTGLVFWATKNFERGCKVRPTSWKRQPKKFAHLPSCPID